MVRSVGRAPSVLQVVLTLNPGGTERLVLEIVRRLRFELPMAVCCLDDEGAWGNQLKASGVEVNALRRAPGFRPALSREIARLVARHQVDVVHCHHYSPFVYAALARLWRPRLGVIFTEHGRLSDAPPSAKRRVANTVLSRMASRTVAVSADLKRYIVAEGFSDEQVDVIHNGIVVGPSPDPHAKACARRKLGVSNAALVIGTIARLNPVKDLDTLIRATAALGAGEAATLVVIGDGPERERLEALAVQLHADVRFLGHREDAREWLAGCDVYANSSIHEGISLTILEAMAAGLPVVATAVGGTPEILDATCGRLVPARNSGAMAAALQELALAPSLRDALGVEARRQVETRFTIERMVGQYREAYLRVAN